MQNFKRYVRQIEGKKAVDKDKPALRSLHKNSKQLRQILCTNQIGQPYDTKQFAQSVLLCGMCTKQFAHSNFYKAIFTQRFSQSSK